MQDWPIMVPITATAANDVQSLKSGAELTKSLNGRGVVVQMQSSINYMLSVECQEELRRGIVQSFKCSSVIALHIK